MEIENLVTTRTIIAHIPLEFDIAKIFQKTPLRKTIDNYDCHVIACYYQNEYKGDEFEKEKKKASFRNAVNIIILHKSKKLNMKVSAKGNFQITGCKNVDQVISGLKYFLTLLHSECPEVIKGWKEEININFQLVMTNIVFDVGFYIDKIKLNKVLKEKSHFYNLFETNFGYTGMNIKIPLQKEGLEISCPQIKLNNNQWNVVYEKCTITPKKKKFNTFLVFHSGKVIMSGMCEENMNKDYLFFKDFLLKHKEDIREKIDS